MLYRLNRNRGRDIAHYFLTATSQPPLCFMFYNFCSIHKTLKFAPAMAAGVTNKLWSMEDIVTLIDARDDRRARRRSICRLQQKSPHQRYAGRDQQQKRVLTKSPA
jgi:hypothetical protein